MTFQRSYAVSTFVSVAAALVFFLPMTGAAQTADSASPSALTVTPRMFRFAKCCDDRSFRMTTDAAGNFYIASDLDDLVHLNSFGVLKYGADGKLLGAFHFKAAAGFAVDIKVDADGNIYAGGPSLLGGLVVSFDPSGKARWSHIVGDSVTAMALDKSGNVYAGGVQSGAMIVAKFAANGKPLWHKLHQGTASGSGVSDVQADNKGNAIVFGDTTNAGPFMDTTILKINPDGKVLWVRNFTEQPQFNKVPAGGAVDHNDGIYVTGQGVDLFTGDRFPYTLKYDTNGNLIFALTGAGNGGTSVAVDPAGEILLSGFTFVLGNPLSTASKLDPSGKQVWVTQIPAFGKILSDAKGNVFTAGSEYTVAKLNSAGTILWTFQGSSQFSEFSTTGAVVDRFGNLIVTGNGFDFNVGQQDIVTLKFPRNAKPHSAR
jgi:hypothetical protein